MPPCCFCCFMLSYHLSFVAHPPWCSVGGSPTAYRLGFGSPTRLVRFGFVGEMASSLGEGLDDSSPFAEDGTLTPCSGSSTTKASVFFRFRLGGSTAFRSPGSVWITMPCSWSCGGTSTFFRDLVFFTTGAGETATAASDEGGCARSSWWHVALSTGEGEGVGGVPRGGSGGT